MNDALKIVDVVKNARVSVTSTIKLLADKYVEEATLILKRYFQKYPNDCFNKCFSVGISYIDFLTPSIKIEESVWSEEDIYEYFTPIMKYEGDILKATNSEQTREYKSHDFSEFFQELEKRGFKVYAYDDGGISEVVYPFIRVE